MSDRPIGLGKVAENGTLNENGAFYSVQDVEALLKKNGTPNVDEEDVGKVLTVGKGGEWEATEEYDLAYSLQYNSGNWMPTLLQGNYDSLVQKITNKKPIKVLAYKYARSGTDHYCTSTGNVTLVYREGDGNSISVYAYFELNSALTSYLNQDNEMTYE